MSCIILRQHGKFRWFSGSRKFQFSIMTRIKGKRMFKDRVEISQFYAI